MTRFISLLLTIFLALAANGFLATSPYAKNGETSLASLTLRKGEVYFLRGFGDVFSRGLDQMAAKLTKRRVKAVVLSHNQWQTAVDTIVANRKKYGRRPVVLIGHSLGANAALRIATELKRKRIAVSYMVTFAATAPEPASSNIRKLTNYYFKTDGWGRKIERGQGFRGVLTNIDFSRHKKIGHFNIDKQPRIQRQVIRNIMRTLGVARNTGRQSSATSKQSG